jgi:hypothetical protein
MLGSPEMGGPAPVVGPQLLPDGGLGQFQHNEDHALLDAAAAYAAVEALTVGLRWARNRRAGDPQNAPVRGFRRHPRLVLPFLILGALCVYLGTLHMAEFAWLSVGFFGAALWSASQR